MMGSLPVQNRLDGTSASGFGALIPVQLRKIASTVGKFDAFANNQPK